MSTSRFRRSGIYVRFWKGDTQLNNAYAAANDDCLEWQFLSGSIEATKAYDRVEVMLVYNYNANSAIFDGAQLFKEEFAYRYTYDSSGRVTKVTDLEGRVTSYAYRDDSSDITSITLPGGAQYSYSYNENNLLSGTVSAEGVQTTHSYDAWGNATQTTITYAGNTGPVIQSDQTYTADGNFQTSATTGDRNTVTYNYDTERSTLSSVTDALGSSTTNAYDIMRRLTSTTTGGASVSYAYDGADRLASITHSGQTPTTYSFAYTTAGLTDTVRIGERVLSDNAYNTGTWTLASQTYGNGQSWSYEYDAFDQLTRRYSGNTEFKYFYNNEGALARVEQYNNSVLTAVERWYYDTGDRLTRVVELDGSGNVTHSYGWTYDHNDKVTALTETVNGQTFTYNYSYNSDQQPTSMGGAVTKNYTYDNYGRLSGSSGGPLGVGYTYRDIDATYTTTQVATLTNTYAGTAHSLSYTYDANGNILSVSDGTNTTSYVYDSLGQLTRENNQAAGKTWTWTYDTGGNILSRSEYAYTTGELGTATDTVSYTYGDAAWGDLLTAYDGAAITYDGVGNMTAYDGWTFTWQGGRQLAGMSNGTTTLSFDYNESGLRTKKSDGSTTHSYIYRGEQLIADVTATDALYFRYDQNGDVLGFSYNGAEYTYVKNCQNDILVILDSEGKEAASYSYDAWGNILSVGGYDSNLANRNPLRYRGYMYDAETGLYYLQSRYYDPEIGRFINADAYAQTYNSAIGANMFAYCGNDPVNRSDPDGADWQTAFAAGFTVAVAGLVVLATLPFSGPLLAGAGVAAATVATVANATIAAGLTVAGGALFQAAISSNTNPKYDGKTTYHDKEKNERIEYEYYGNGNGNVHYELGSGDKTPIWRLKDGVETTYKLPQKIEKIIMSKPKMQQAILKAVNRVKALAGVQ